MLILFSEQAWEEYAYWLDNDIKIAKKIKELITVITKEPFSGIGKPEPLKYNLKGFWSRRITSEHRLVYQVTGKKGEDQTLTIIQCRFHYDG